MKISISNESLLYSAIINRVNYFKLKKNKKLIIFDKYFLLLNPNDTKKRLISLHQITKIICITKTNFIIIQVSDIQDEIIEVFNKNEFLLFMKKIFKHNNYKLELLNRPNYKFKNSSGEILVFDPFIDLKNSRNYYNNLFAHSEKVGVIKIIKKGVLNDKLIDVVAIMCDIGILCLDSVNYSVLTFIPIINIKDICIRNNSIILDYGKEFDNFKVYFNSNYDLKDWVKIINKNKIIK